MWGTLRVAQDPRSAPDFGGREGLMVSCFPTSINGGGLSRDTCSVRAVRLCFSYTGSFARRPRHVARSRVEPSGSTSRLFGHIIDHDPTANSPRWRGEAERPITISAESVPSPCRKTDCSAGPPVALPLLTCAASNTTAPPACARPPLWRPALRGDASAADAVYRITIVGAKN